MILKVLFVTFLVEFAHASVDLSSDEDGFSLKFHNIEVLRHKRSYPLLSVASGKVKCQC